MQVVYTTTVMPLISFVFSSWIINEYYIYIYTTAIVISGSSNEKYEEKISWFAYTFKVNSCWPERDLNSHLRRRRRYYDRSSSN